MRNSNYSTIFLLSLGLILFICCKPKESADPGQEELAENTETVEAPAPRNILMAKHEVADYAKWKPGFDEHESVRLESGLHKIGVARNLDNPNVIHLAFFIDDVEKAKSFANSDDLKAKMEELGVQGPPAIQYLQEIRIEADPTDITERVMVSHEVADYAKWKEAYDENKPARDENGLSERALMHEIGNPNNVFLVFAYEHRQKVEDMLASEELKSVMENAGVTGELGVDYFNWEELSVD